MSLENETRNILKLMRSFNRINEQESGFDLVNNVEVNSTSNDKDDINLSDNEKNVVNQLMMNFRTQVSEVVNFDNGINIKSDEVRLDGSFNSNLMFTFILSNQFDGVYITTEMIELDEDNLSLINKLKQFVPDFRDVANQLIQNRQTN